jgi:hypothetical protein
VTRRAHPKYLVWHYTEPDTGEPHARVCPEARALARYLNADATWCYAHPKQARVLRAAYV